MKTKKKICWLTIMMLISFGLISLVMAEDSVNQKTLQPSVVSSDTNNVVISEADPTKYENEEVAVIVTLVNSDVAEITPAEIVESLSKSEEEGQSAENYTTTSGEEVNLMLYDSLTPMMDLGIAAGDSVTFDGNPGTVTIKIPEAAGLDGNNLLIMQIDPKTGAVSIITLTAFDPETGELKANFKNLGPFMLISKLPLINKDTDPEKYPNEDVAELVKSSSTSDYISLQEWMNAQDITENKLTIEVPVSEENKSKKTGFSSRTVYASQQKETKTVTLNINQYEAVTLLSDLAVQIGSQDVGYDLNTDIKANIYQDLNRTNWTRILNYAGIKYDVEKIKNNPDLLNDIEPFVLKKAFVYHIDASTGESSFVYEPTISFDSVGGMSIKTGALQDPPQSGFNVDLSSLFQNKVYAEMKEIDHEKVSWFDIKNDHQKNCVVISGEGLRGLGPYILFLPTSNGLSSFAWIGIVAALLIIAVAGFIIFSRKKQKSTES